MCPTPRWRDWTRRTLTCGVALQCSPSKDRLADYRLNELSARELRALTLRRSRRRPGLDRVALARAAARSCGECCPTSTPPPPTWTPRRCSPGQLHWRGTASRIDVASAAGHACRRRTRCRRGSPTSCDAASAGCPGPPRRSVFHGHTPFPSAATAASAIPTCRRRADRRTDDLDITPDHRPGIPYPEWNAWTKSFMPRPRRGARARTHQPDTCVRRPVTPICASGSKSTPIAR